MKKYILSGIEPDDSGTGRLMQYLTADASSVNVTFLFFPFYLRELRAALFSKNIKTIISYFRKAGIYLKIWSLALPGFGNKENELILFHPQNLGYWKTLFFLRIFRGQISWYLLDSSFFCIRSYNHLQGETTPCLRCLGSSTSRATEFGCQPFPTRNWYAHQFFIQIRSLVKSRNIKIIAQNKNQADLAKRHFGTGNIFVAGLWTIDFEAQGGLPATQTRDSYDVVFHGHFHAAKGALWALELASKMPSYRFLFPFPKEALPKEPSANCFFENITWESGLHERVTMAKCVIVPSLWSAPIEGALIKSIFWAKKVAVVENESSYSSELPKKLVTSLSSDTSRAFLELENLLKAAPPDENQKLLWIQNFRKNKFTVAMNLFSKDSSSTERN